MNKIIDGYQIFKESENINNILKHISTEVKSSQRPIVTLSNT